MAPALAERLHELQAEAAAVVAVWRTWGDHAAAARVLDFEGNVRARQPDADDDGVRGARAAVAHAVGDQLGYEQPGAVEHAGRDAAAQTLGDDDPRGAGRARVTWQPHGECPAAVEPPLARARAAALGAQLGVFDLHRRRAATQRRDRLRERVNPQRLRSAERAQLVELRARTDAPRQRRWASVRRGITVLHRAAS